MDLKFICAREVKERGDKERRSITHIVEKARATRLQWFVYVIRREEDPVKKKYRENK